MANEGATFYYFSNKELNYEEIIINLEKFDLLVRNPDTQLISGTIEGNEFEETEEKNFHQFYHNKNHRKQLGINLWVKNNELSLYDRVFWTNVTKNNFCYHNFTFCFLDYIQIEEIVSQSFIKLALIESARSNKEFMGFTLDQFGHQEDYNFAKLFHPNNNEILTHHYISDITFLPRNKIKRLTLGSESEVIRINQKFDCIAKNPELADYLKSLL